MRKTDWHPAVDSKNVVGRFIELPRRDVTASWAAGEPKEMQQVYCHVKVQGSEDYNAIRMTPKRAPEQIKRFPDAWKAFQGEEVEETGTPLSEVPGMMPETASAYMLAGIRNAEALAEVSDSAVANLGMGALGFRKSARLLAENAKLKAEAERNAALDKLVEKPKRRGRPPKAAA